METFIRNVDEIDSRDQQSLEHVLGRSLQEDQQLVINIVSREISAVDANVDALNTPSPPAALPDRCNVYEGLSEAELGALEKAILLPANLSRTFE